MSHVTKIGFWAGLRAKAMLKAGWRWGLAAAFLLSASSAFAAAGDESWARTGERPEAGAFRAVMVQEPESLDPHGPLDPAAWPVILACYYRLTTLKNGLAEPVPALARTIRVSDDGLRYTFVLHEGFTFSDGQPLDSEAVLFSFDRLMGQEAGRKHFAPLKRLEIIGPHTFALILDRPWPAFLNALASPPASLVSPGLAGRPEDYLRDHTLGAGRFVLESRRPGEIILAARLDLANRPRLGRAVFHYQPDPEQRLRLFESVRAHLLQAPAAQARLPENFEARIINTFNSRYLAFNQEKPWALGLKRELSALIRSLHLETESGGRRLQGLFPEGLYQNWAPEAADIDVLGDVFPEEAPWPLVLALEDPPGPGELQDAHRLAEAMIKRGLTVRVEAQPAVQLAKGGYDFFLGTKRPGTGSPDEWLSSLVGPDNRALYQNALAEALIWEISTASQRLTRVAKLNELTRLLYEAEAYLFLYQEPFKVWVDRRVRGYNPHPMWPESIPLDTVSLEMFRPAAPGKAEPPAADPAMPLPDDPDPLGLDWLD